jgi:molybdenum cofactor synthesis domain-containing protein
MKSKKHAFISRMSETAPTASVLIIGNEILSGRTPDANLAYIAKKLAGIGVKLCEARVVPDIEADIVKAVNELRAHYTYVITTGGIGPTHDDITASSVAKAFGKKLIEHPEARTRLMAYYTETSINPARLRMAMIPEGADLIDNPISAAPGFRVENVYVLAGVPGIMQAMMDQIAATMKHGPAIHSIAMRKNIQRRISAPIPGSGRGNMAPRSSCAARIKPRCRQPRILFSLWSKNAAGSRW